MARIVSVTCMSHSPFLFAEADEWQLARAARQAVPNGIASEVPLDTPEENEEKNRRCKLALSKLKANFEADKPDVVVIFGDDQLEQFSFQNMPALCIFTGQELAGYKISPFFGLPIPGRKREHRPKTKEHWAEIKTHPELAKFLAIDLVARGFDMAFSSEIGPHGIGHAFTRPMEVLNPEFDIPIVPIYLNCFYGPQPTGKRCYELGKAVTKAIEAFPADITVAVVGSGGLWHTPMVENAYIDHPFDKEVVDAITSGAAHRMADLIDSRAPAPGERDSAEIDRLSAGSGMVFGLGSGSGEVRTWVAAAASAEPVQGEMVDYIAINASPIGVGFASWKLGHKAPEGPQG